MKHDLPRVRVGHFDGKWSVSVRHKRSTADGADWLMLGRCNDTEVAFRLWLALQGEDQRK